MTIARELLRLAEVLASTEGGLPGLGHVGRNRAISTAYYAVFHGLARLCAVQLARARPSKEAYQHIYRSLDHSHAKTIFKRVLEDRATSESAKRLAAIFIDLQGRRHEADYDCFYYVKNRRELNLLLGNAATALDSLEELSAPERKLLAARLVGRIRR